MMRQKKKSNNNRIEDKDNSRQQVGRRIMSGSRYLQLSCEAGYLKIFTTFKIATTLSRLLIIHWMCSMCKKKKKTHGCSNYSNNRESLTYGYYILPLLFWEIEREREALTNVCNISNDQSRVCV